MKSSTTTQKPTSTSSQLPFSTAPSVANDNNIEQPKNNNTTGSLSNITTVGNTNREGNGDNGVLPGSGNSSGNTTAIATGNRNGHGNGLGTGSGSDGLACRRCPPPNYPSGSEGMEGRAVVEIDVEKDGSVKDVQMVESTGHDNLDHEVMETVKKKWKFVSTDSEQHVQAAVNFAKAGSNFERQARERVRQAQELQQKRRRERQAQKQQRRERVRFYLENPVAPDTISTPRLEPSGN
ncbi:MAG: TonB family protein [Rhizonema sp. PD37]|nr:TonB family protein [Rhizonema sp. PD37]